MSATVGLREIGLTATRCGAPRLFRFDPFGSISTARGHVGLRLNAHFLNLVCESGRGLNSTAGQRSIGLGAMVAALLARRHPTNQSCRCSCRSGRSPGLPSASSSRKDCKRRVVPGVEGRVRAVLQVAAGQYGRQVSRVVRVGPMIRAWPSGPGRERLPAATRRPVGTTGK
jgi:hypothetical protein